ncbi:MAG: sulfatase-like hydrolase/transferase [Saprospiraceae bacterium]|nr:sulfatase-like hydrolase/transferase [Saprospiraceae bacterium]
MRVLAWLWFLMVLLMGCKGDVQTSPNVIVIMADDLGYETIAANGGSSYATPAIDEMARQGVRFEHCYSQPLCTPSRVKIMTGIYNVRNYVRFGILDTNQTTFGHLFRDAGYSTCIIGKWQLGKATNSPEQAGFDEHCLWQVTEGRIDSVGRDTRFSRPVLQTNGRLEAFGGEQDFGPSIVRDFGIDFMERAVAADQPFLLYYPMILTHCPFSPTPDSPEWLTDDTTVLDYKGHAHYFEDMMSYTDRIVGSINDKLEELGIADNTLVLFTGDNGTDVPVVSLHEGREVAGAKGTSTDAGTRVPLIIKATGKVEQGIVCRDLVDFSDVLPTICDFAAIEVPTNLEIDGRSFLAQLQGKAGNPRDWIYNWYSRNGQEDKARVFVRNRRYKLYSAGEFYDVAEDALEAHPLSLDALPAEAEKARVMFQDVLDQYADRRGENLENFNASGQ